MKLRQKMFIFSASMAVISVLITALFAHQIASTQIQHALIERTQSHLISIRNAKPAKLEADFNQRLNQAQIDDANRSRVIEEAMRGFQEAVLKSTVALALVFLVIGSAVGLLYYLRFIATPINHLKAIITQVADGDYHARASLKTEDEFETLSHAFNGLLEGRIRRLLIKGGYFNCEMLNNSIIELLKGAFQLSQCDLTVQIPVTHEQTGTLADAINQMAFDISQALLTVRRIGENIEITCQQVKKLGENVSKIVQAEREVADTTVLELSATAEAMIKIAEVVQSCQQMASHAISSTDTALDMMVGTQSRLVKIRETIQETKEPVKRLGERIQEMTHLITIINTIAERTFEMASNPAVAGDAGCGGSEMAKGLQQLTESMLDAIVQMSMVVKNIQAENNQTIASISQSITQVNKRLVAEEVPLGELVSRQIKNSHQRTAKLLPVLAQIATSFRQQAKISDDLWTRIEVIKDCTNETSAELEAQMKLTNDLVAYTTIVRKSILVFKLQENSERF